MSHPVTTHDPSNVYPDDEYRPSGGHDNVPQFKVGKDGKRHLVQPDPLAPMRAELMPEQKALDRIDMSETPTRNLARMVEDETQTRKILTKYITEHLKEGVDFGKVGPSQKPTLLKPGTEKFCSLMGLTVKFSKDSETFEMAGSPQGLFCYKAILVNRDGRVIGEGRGACSIQEKKNANTAIKIALKRAQTDAVLRSGGLSDFFTQDLEDMEPEQKSVTAEAVIDLSEDPFADLPKSKKEVTQDEQTCPECGVGKLVHKSGMSKRTGKAYAMTACDQYPRCKYVLK